MFCALRAEFCAFVRRGSTLAASEKDTVSGFDVVSLPVHFSQSKEIYS